MMKKPFTFVALAIASVFALSVQAMTEQTETIDLKSMDGQTKLVLVSNGEQKSFAWSDKDFSDPTALEAALADVPEAQREKIKKLLQQMQEGQLTSLTGNGEHKIIVKRLDKDGVITQLSDDDMKKSKIFIKQFKVGDGQPFDAIKHLIKDTDLTKEQLQELQKLIDSKY